MCDNSDILLRGREEETIDCPYCHALMRKGTIAFHVDRKDCHLTLDKVPAWVCQQCGEPYFDEVEADAIQDLIRSLEQKTQALALTR